ncbi:hypothetical protein ACFOMD_09860 [Sphingoaurantiacus capsulatus]|uniref:Uncharacterized protein n=1 Tax=Sphingoaurantiacus capsulatus TaxID=1771310 RepID=A0ABV7X9R8_9SPHN
MPQLDLRRFKDVRVGEALPATVATALGDMPSWSEMARRYVRNWAGPGALIAEHLATVGNDTGADEIEDIAGSIYARHLDDSYNIDVRVVARTRSGTRLVDIVRVRLH